MKVTAYLRVARQKGGRATIAATAKPSTTALRDPRGHELPTVAFAVALDVPDAMFNRASQVIATLRIPEEAATIVATVEEADDGR